MIALPLKWQKGSHTARTPSCSVWLNAVNTGCSAFCVQSCAKAETRQNFHIPQEAEGHTTMSEKSSRMWLEGKSKGGWQGAAGCLQGRKPVLTGAQGAQVQERERAGEVGSGQSSVLGLR